MENSLKCQIDDSNTRLIEVIELEKDFESGCHNERAIYTDQPQQHLNPYSTYPSDASPPTTTPRVLASKLFNQPSSSFQQRPKHYARQRCFTELELPMAPTCNAARITPPFVPRLHNETLRQALTRETAALAASNTALLAQLRQKYVESNLSNQHPHIQDAVRQDLGLLQMPKPSKQALPQRFQPFHGQTQNKYPYQQAQNPIPGAGRPARPLGVTAKWTINGDRPSLTVDVDVPIFIMPTPMLPYSRMIMKPNAYYGKP